MRKDKLGNLGWMQWLTGARPTEQKRVLACFGSLFCLLASYYLIKPLRNSQFLKDFLPESLPIYYLGVSLLSFAITIVFRHFYGRVSKSTLLTATFSTICLVKVLFFALLLHGGKAVTVGFCLFAAIYFLLALAATWGCINDIFDAEQGERCFGFVATGSTLGCIAGSALAKSMVALGPATLLVSTAFMMSSLAFLLTGSRCGPVSPNVLRISPSTGIRARGFWPRFLDLLGDKYLRCLATMVVGLAVFTTGIDLISQKQMDRRLAEVQYNESFAALDPLTRQEGFDFVYGLRKLSESEASKALQGFGESRRLDPEVEQALPAWYQDYRKQLNLKTSKFFAYTFYYQGICGAVLLVVALKMFFAVLGVRGTVLLLPVFSLASLWIFAAPLDLATIQIMLVAGGTLNYTLNNATKEVLYTVASTDAKFKTKPLIEGPGMRSGDVIASIVSPLCAYAVSRMGLPSEYKDYLYLGFCSLWVLLWLRAAYWVGKEYEWLKAVIPDPEPAPE